jgi:hypothetical protein
MSVVSTTMNNSIPMHLHTLPPLLADLGYSMLVPEGFVQGQLPKEDVDFGNPTQFAPLAIFASPVAMAIITVAARPAYETGSVVQWMRYLMEHYELEAESVRVGRVGQSDEHPALIISAKQEQEGQKLRFAVVAFEDGGRFLNVQGICPEELWPSFGTALTEAVRSVTLASPKGPIHDLDSMDAEGWERITPQQYKKQMAQHAKERQAARAPAIFKAEKLLAENLFDEAEREIMQVDSTIEGSVAIARIYEAQLQSLVAGGKHTTNREHAEMLFHRALSWAKSCYPEAHTEVEAEDYQQGRTEDRARLVKILGWDPDAA